VIGQTISHYRIIRQLGAGGMGVVYEAVDTKLDRTVALKFLPPESTRDPDAKARFIHEAKAASSLDHPNICTIHGIEETDDGRLFIAMARYEGETLKDMISRGPFDIHDVVDIIIQTLQGLGKAHRLGIVHRDIKPANVFVTSDGLVKLLDFGIAKLAGQTQVTRTGSMLGTVHYMAPEQLQGEEVDRRADLWSVGILVYEMLTGRLPFTGDHQPAVMYAILNTDPKPLAELRKDVPTELGAVAERCLQKVPAGRFQGVEELLLNLKPLVHQGVNRTADKRTVSLRNEADALNVQPYPGVAFFTEREVEYFHGRESRVESVWQKLRRGRFLAVTGPSGVGKTSFLRAGLIPAKPADWGVILTTPGGSPLLSLREAMVPELTDDTGAIRALLREKDLDATVAGIRRWRDRHDEALLIFDQFEELFTLNPREEQERFADLLSRLTFEADVHVLVSLRDDFLFHCQEFAGLAPLYESLTVLGPLTGASLRRALVQPALDCGYEFEDESIVDEMMAEVEGERGALPLLAFAMARLWEGRDREQGVLTRQAYEKMGAVSGALAQHAESVMDQIGADNHPIVQELFRNLVTAQGTRAVQDREKILSVFDAADRPAAKEIQGKLIDARLLTSYEVKSEDGTEHHRIEIVHESLLNAWPRLVRWRTQDEDSAQLRDQLRQAAQLWEQKDRSDDLLWTGTAFLEFELWRGRYPGGLSTEEADFASAMKSRNLRRKRRRRVAVAGAFVALLAVLAVVVAFGKRAERMARVSEARRFHMLAEEQLEVDNTLSLALATESLEREDNPVVRKLALAALWKAPCRQVFPLPDSMAFPALSVRLSPDGKWLALGNNTEVLLWPADGSEPRIFPNENTTVPYRFPRASPGPLPLQFHTELT
jgi:serine/threonine protein kinase